MSAHDTPLYRMGDRPHHSRARVDASEVRYQRSSDRAWSGSIETACARFEASLTTRELPAEPERLTEIPPPDLEGL